MTMIATTKKRGTFIPGSGIGKNPGHIAGGSFRAVPPGGTGVFGQRPYTKPAPSVVVGGLIDKRQQIDGGNTSTAGLPHPFDSPNYRPIATQKQNVARVATGNIPGQKIFSPSVKKVLVTDTGTFFARKPQPIVRTVGGANKSGAKSDTAFHPAPRPANPIAVGTPTVEGARIARTKIPSFGTMGNHWSDPNNSFVKGAASVANPQSQATGRWGTTKRSAV